MKLRLRLLRALLRVRKRPLLCVFAFLPGTAVLNEQLPEVAAFVPADQDGIALQALLQTFLNTSEPTQSIVAAHGMLRTIDGASAFVKISEGL